MIQKFIYNEDGQTLVEYGLLIALIALLATTAVALFSSKMKNALYDDVASQL